MGMSNTISKLIRAAELEITTHFSVFGGRRRQLRSVRLCGRVIHKANDLASHCFFFFLLRLPNMRMHEYNPGIIAANEVKLKIA